MPEPPKETDDDKEEDWTCPICLSASHEVSESVVFCKSPCGHIFCVPCLEHFLLKPKSNMLGGRIGEDEDDHYYHRQRPNTGSCPMCRRSVNLFDLINIQCGSQVYSKNSTIRTWPICDIKYSMQSMLRQSSSSTEDQQLLNRLTAVEGAINGYGLEFDFSSASPGIRFCSNMYPESRDEAPSDQTMNGRMEFLPFNNYHFFAKTMTFQGDVQFPTCVTRPSKSDYRYDQLECLLQFSDNGHFVREGYLRWKLQSTTSNTESTTPQHFPLDGTWEVMWTSGQSIKIHVQRHFFDCFQNWYEIELDDCHRPRFTWPFGFGLDVVQTSEQSLPPGSQGPAVGETFEWKTNSPMPEYSTIVWRRLGTDLSDAWRLIRLKPKRFVFKRILAEGQDEDTSLPRATYHSDSLWGNTFCQAFCVGLASYHFLGPNDGTGELEAYISYEHPRTSSWPPLDNGSSVPSRVPFRNISYDADTRTFRGDISWLEVYGTRWVGEAKWSYEIRFDPQFLYVEGGTCQRSEGHPHHEFGLDLVYVNAAIEDPLRDSIEANESSVGYNSASEATKSMIRHVIMNLVQDPETSLFDFNL